MNMLHDGGGSVGASAAAGDAHDLPLVSVALFLGFAGEDGGRLSKAATTIARAVQAACVRCGIHSLADPRWGAATTLITDIGSQAWDLADLDHGGWRRWACS